MLAGFQQYNIQPRPLIFVQHADLVWALIASLFIANVMLLVPNLPLVGLWVQLLKIPMPWLYAGILVFAAMGTIAANSSVVELLLLCGFGVLGFVMRRYDYPVALVIVGLILGPIADSQLRRALQMSLSDPMVLLQHPGSAIMIAIALIALIAPLRDEGTVPLPVGRGLTARVRRRTARPIPREPEMERQNLALGSWPGSSTMRAPRACAADSISSRSGWLTSSACRARRSSARSAG